MYPSLNKPTSSRRTPVVAGLLGLLGLLAMPHALAGPTLTDQIDWWTMSMTLLGGLSLFLFGMEQMAAALKSVAGDSMKQILAKLTNSRIMGLLTGAFVTAVIQSSSVTTVMLVGFVSANLMSLAQAIGVILGADIGTTITAQIVAFKVTKYALLLVAIGFVMLFTAKSERLKQYGHLIMGLGLIFFGMALMSDGMRPLRSYEPFISLMQNVSNPIIGILVATLFTSLIQSSSATMGVVIALAMQGLISLEGGIALALGANIGTCATAGLAAIGKPREAVRVAVAHVTFKIVGVLLIVGFIPYFADLVRHISPAAAGDLVGMDRLAAETPRQIANAHTIFNVAIAFLFLPASAWFARFCEWLVPDKPLAAEEPVAKSRYLDPELVETPALALDRARLELAHMGKYVLEMLRDSVPALLAGNRTRTRELRELDEQVDSLYGQIITYLGKVSRVALTHKQTEELMGLMAATNDLENIGDLIETDTHDLAQECFEKSIRISDSSQKMIVTLHAMVTDAVENALRSVENQDYLAAHGVIARKDAIGEQADMTAQHQAERLIVDEPNRLETYSIEVELIEKLKRIYYFAKRMAKTVPPPPAGDQPKQPETGSGDLAVQGL